MLLFPPTVLPMSIAWQAGLPVSPAPHSELHLIPSSRQLPFLVCSPHPRLSTPLLTSPLPVAAETCPGASVLLPAIHSGAAMVTLLPRVSQACHGILIMAVPDADPWAAAGSEQFPDKPHGCSESAASPASLSHHRLGTASWQTTPASHQGASWG